MKRQKSVDIKKIAVAGMLTAIAYLATFLTSFFKVGGFLSLDVKEAVIAIISLLYGPAYGLASVITVALVEFATISTTGFYGLVMNILSSGTFAIICGFIYKFRRRFSGAIIAAICSALGVTAVMLIANIFITPLYFGMPRSAVIDMLPSLLLPFNLFKGIMNASIMLLIYKPLITSLRRARLVDGMDSSRYKFTGKSAILLAVSALLLTVAIFVMLRLGIEVK